MSSPARRHLRTGSSGSATFRRPQNTAARAAAQRLAQVMSHQSADDGDDEEDDGLALSSISVPAGRSSARSPSPKTAKKRSPSPAVRIWIHTFSFVWSTSVCDCWFISVNVVGLRLRMDDQDGHHQVQIAILSLDHTVKNVLKILSDEIIF